MTFYYVYLLQSDNSPARHYVGFTTDLRSRLVKHNSGQVSYTANNRPWHVMTAIAFDSQEKARRFEKYLKTGSGRAFAKMHF